ncbi:MAG: rhodanese-related sulfurtransferase [Flavobacteriales bacterium]|nr:rhodanese-related sulfurtransferase [Flavobacteriales bacterium]MDW8431164.1 rhodanese-related sulfurtransferase [Flavobacteriales bacterium]
MALSQITFSFYKYLPIDDPEAFRNRLYEGFQRLGVLGRVYVALEGVNGQVSCNPKHFEAVRDFLYAIPGLENMRLNRAVAETAPSFRKLHVKVRRKIVADGLNDPAFDPSKPGIYLDAESFNRLTDHPDTLVVDMRNHYEYAVGHFEKALGLSAETFREALPEALHKLKDYRHRPSVMYCTGGIRCEKASAWFRHHGFEKVYQLEGGIIEYARQVKEKGLVNKFHGVNFVFDDRLGEPISSEIISRCQQCGRPTARQVNCAHDGCHLLFIQCDDCGKKFHNCCSSVCQTVIALPESVQKWLRQGLSKGRMVHGYFRRRPYQISSVDAYA